MSAWWFIEIYLWSRPVSDQLDWTLKGDMSTPDRLNERPIYLRAFFFMLAVAQSTSHLYYDYSSIEIPVAPALSPTSSDLRTHPILSVYHKARQSLPSLLARSVVSCFGLAIAGPFIYAFTLRTIFWSLHLALAKPFFSIPRSDAQPTGYPPCNIWMMARSFYASLLLAATWEASIFFFSAFLVQEPTEKGEPLSTTSKDANGTLLTGLVAKRDLVKNFAFWELAEIARNRPKRRKFIFMDIGREGGSAWSQMSSAALAVIQQIDSRIDLTKQTSAQSTTTEAQVENLPHIVPPAKTVDSIFSSAPPPKTRGEKIESIVAYGAKRVGQSSRPYSPDLPKTKSLIDYGASKAPAVTATLSSSWSFLTESPVGLFFRSSFERRVNCVVLGSPQGNPALIVDAIEAITRFSLASLDEDDYGAVRKTIPGIVRKFTATIQTIESFVQSVEAKPNQDSDIENVEIVLARLKAGLAEILGGFEIYLVDEGLSALEHRKAKRASAPQRLHERVTTDSGNPQFGCSVWDFCTLILEFIMSLSRAADDISHKKIAGNEPSHPSDAKVAEPGRPQRAIGREQSSRQRERHAAPMTPRATVEMEHIR